MEGTLGGIACLFLCVLGLILLYGLQLNSQQWIQVLVACTLTCILEALTDKNDNLILPFYFEVVLTLASFY